MGDVRAAPVGLGAGLLRSSGSACNLREHIRPGASPVAFQPAFQLLRRRILRSASAAQVQDWVNAVKWY
jgi:hypothetical protein